MEKMGGGSMKNFRQKICLVVPKIFAGEPFCDVLQKTSDSQRSLWKEEGGSIKILFRLTVPIDFLAKPFSVSLSSGTEKF